MRPTTMRIAAFILLTLCPQLGHVCAVGAERGPDPKDATMEKFIAAVRAAEEKYRDIEYTIRLTTRKVDPKVTEGPGEVVSEGTRRVVLQGDQVWFRGEMTSRVFKTDQRREEISAYDGERTRTVVAGNSVNIHLGRFEHPELYPPIPCR